MKRKCFKTFTTWLGSVCMVVTPICTLWWKKNVNSRPRVQFNNEEIIREKWLKDKIKSRIHYNLPRRRNCYRTTPSTTQHNLVINQFQYFHPICILLKQAINFLIRLQISGQTYIRPDLNLCKYLLK